MPLKFYLHDATAVITGNTPPSSPGENLGGTSTSPDSWVSHSMNQTIGVAQASQVYTNGADVLVHRAMIKRFCSVPLSAQTIAAQTVTFRFGAAESNASSDFLPKVILYQWRPSSGVNVAVLVSNTTGTVTEPGTTETDTSYSVTSTAATLVDGDIIVMEIVRNGLQAMGTAYTNTVYYDGTTEGSTTSNAAYLLFTNDVALFLPLPDPIRFETSPGRRRGNAVHRSTRW